LIFRRLTILLAALLFVACQADSGPPLVAAGIQVFLPLPGRTAAVAYFEIENRSGKPISIRGISSPQFASSTIHETTLIDGVSRMQAVEQVSVERNSSVSFEPGGLHVMLMNPVDELTANAIVTLEIHYDQAGLMIIEARARPRSNP
jgi:copper(I)-binding protein